MKIAVIGAGFTGLTAAYSLTKKGHQVIVYEKNAYLGGLSAGFKEKNWQWSLDKFYRHLFASDHKALQLIKELELTSRFHFYRPTTAVQIKKTQLPLNGPLDLLKFPYLNLWQKIRMAVILGFLRYNPFWRPFENYRAHEWLAKTMGNLGFQTLWQPLLKSKFGRHSDQINLTWFWTRIRKRSSSLGYLDGGFQVLIDRLGERIKKNNGQIFLSSPVGKIISQKNHRFQIQSPSGNQSFDCVIATCPIPIFLQLAPPLPPAYHHQLTNLKFLSALTLILVLKRKFSSVYWLNIVEKWPFLVLVDHANLASSRYYGHTYPLYLGLYGEKESPPFSQTKEALFAQWLPYLRQVNPRFQKSWLQNLYLFKEDYAQPVVGLHHHRQIPPLYTPIKNLFLANQAQVYPEDRGVNQTIRLGQKVAAQIGDS